MGSTLDEGAAQTTASLISVVIPTVSRPELLTRALESVRRQSYPNWEARVIDDGQGEGIEMADSLHDDRVHAELADGSGQVEARNQAIARAGGGIIAWLDDDDWWEDPEHLERARTGLDQGWRLVYQTGWIVFEDSGVREPFDYLPGVGDFQSYNKILTSSVVYPRELHRRLGPLDTRVGSYFDWDWYLRVLAAGVPLAGIARPGVCYSVHATNVSAAYRSSHRLADFDRFRTKHNLDVSLLNHLLMHRELEHRENERNVND